MDRERFIERVLWVAAVVNVGGALLFAFPGSIGQLAGLPAPVQPVYSAMLGLFVLIFGGVYAWAASDHHVRRPFVTLGAIGKGGAFAVVLACWVAGHASTLSLVTMSADLAFAAVFAWWLVGEAGSTVAASA